MNEPVRSYAPGSAERKALKARLASMAASAIEIPLVIGGKEIRTGDIGADVMPHDHQHVLADWHKAVARARDAGDRRGARGAARVGGWRWEDRAAVFLRAAELLSTTWRATLNAATMLGQSKTAYQAEIDAACELIDFWRFNVGFAQELYAEQPISSPGVWNQLDYRPLEGFVYAVTPFNFTAIGGNLPTAPALMGNTVIWKPAATAMLSGYYMHEAARGGRASAGRDQLRPRRSGDDHATSRCRIATSPACTSPAAPAVFNSMWKTIGANMSSYRTYPRIVGETGGKDFIVAHPSRRSAGARGRASCAAASSTRDRSARRRAASTCRSRSGRRCAIAAVAMIDEIKVGDVARLPELHGRGDRPARRSTKISDYLDDAKRERDDHRRRQGRRRGPATSSEPTLVETADPDYRLLCEEIFGPVVTATSTTTRSGRDAGAWSTRRRRTR